jgi:hypothetical protein
VIFEMSGDSTYLALVDTHQYESFVGPDWASNERLLEPHFIAQMGRNTMLAWETGSDAGWRIEIREGFSKTTGFREITGTIHLSAGEAFLLDYDDLSMAAQFEDNRLPGDDARERRFAAAAGLYDCRVLQLVDPKLYFSTNAYLDPARPSEFIIEIQPALAARPPRQEVPWSQL